MFKAVEMNSEPGMIKRGHGVEFKGDSFSVMERRPCNYGYSCQLSLTHHVGEILISIV